MLLAPRMRAANCTSGCKRTAQLDAPKASFTTLATGARQLVVHEALDSTVTEGSYFSWFTPCGDRIEIRLIVRKQRHCVQHGDCGVVLLVVHALRSGKRSTALENDTCGTAVGRWPRASPSRSSRAVNRKKMDTKCEVDRRPRTSSAADARDAAAARVNAAPGQRDPTAVAATGAGGLPPRTWVRPWRGQR